LVHSAFAERASSIAATCRAFRIRTTHRSIERS
jgi:hypothetical protein